MLNSFDQSYHNLCEEILDIGKQKMIAQIQVQFQNSDIN